MGIMDSLSDVGGAIGALGPQMASSAAGMAMGYIGAQQQMDYQHDLFMNSQQFSADMANTQWQRTVKDMEAAGINPMLAVSRGGPNASPSGGGTPSGNNPGQAAIDAAANSANMVADVQVKQAQAEKLKADAALSRESKGLPSAQIQLTIDQSSKVLEEANLAARQRDQVIELTRNAIQERKLIDARTGNTDADTAILKINKILQQQQIPRSTNEAEAQRSWWMRNIAPYLPNMLGTTNSASGVIRSLR